MAEATVRARIEELEILDTPYVAVYQKIGSVHLIS